MTENKIIDSTIDSCLDSGIFSDLIDVCETCELTGKANESVYLTLMFAYLLNNDTISARLLSERISNGRSPNTIEACWLPLGKPLYERDFVTFHKNALKTSSMSGKFLRLFQCLKDDVRDRTLKSISSVYSSISLKNTMEQLGLTEQVVIQMCTKLGWTYFVESKMFKTVATFSHNIKNNTGLSQLKQLTEIVTHIDQGKSIPLVK